VRDSDDNIELKVPIKGRMGDPDINVNNVINDALGRALKTGAASFLILALQFYGAALMAANMIGDQLSAVRLDPMIFAVGSGVMSDTHRDYANKIAQILQSRPNSVWQG
jgi:hypothetical protein